MKALCESCNSQIITYREGGKIVAECSYCGKSADIPDFDVEDLDEEDEWGQEWKLVLVEK